MMARGSGLKRQGSWSIEDIRYELIEPGSVSSEHELFKLVVSASFIEITSDLYTRNLIDLFRQDSEVIDWLQGTWETEELRQGAALKRYVQTMWPHFDWDSAYATFVELYGPLCSTERLAATRSLEMAARCVVETGTAAFYRMLSNVTQEPVLKDLAARISADEIGHYKRFYRYFRRYNAVEQPGRRAIVRTLWSRIADVDQEDALCAFKALSLTGNPGRRFKRQDYEAWRNGIVQLMKPHMPHDMAIKMLLKPLGMHALISRAVLPIVTSATRFFLVR